MDPMTFLPGRRGAAGVEYGDVSISWWREPPPGATLVDPTLRRTTLLFRILGWAWMTLLVMVGLTSEEGSDQHIEDEWVAIAALAIATVWTACTLWAARDDRVLRARWFVAIDVLTSVVIGGATLLAGTDELFHGGYPMSSVVVAANGGGLRWALPVSLLLGVEQFVVRDQLGRSVSASAFAIVFPVIALVVGTGFDALREHSASRSEAEARLARSEAEKARLEERAALASRLHDSVLQTLNAIQIEASNPEQVSYLARRQQRELKRTIEQFLTSYDKSFRVALMAARDEVEDMHTGVAINTLIKDDLPLDDGLAVVVDAAREAMHNAARHSGADEIDVFSERRGGDVVVMIRDRGSGFDPSKAIGTGGHGLAKSIIERVHKSGGAVSIDSTPGAGTEVTITIRCAPSEPATPAVPSLD